MIYLSFFTGYNIFSNNWLLGEMCKVAIYKVAAICPFIFTPSTLLKLIPIVAITTIL